MSDYEEKALSPWADSEFSGDEGATDFEGWLEDQIDYSELSPEFQRWARLHLEGFKQIDGTWVEINDPVQVLTGQEELIWFMPGDRFTGIEDGGWLIEHALLCPDFGRVRFLSRDLAPSLTFFFDGEEIDPVEQCGGDFPLGQRFDYSKRPIAEVGHDDLFEPDQVAATLYEASPWLVSEWRGVHQDFLPVPTNEMGQESEYRMVHETWLWVLEMTQAWRHADAEHDLPITSELLAVEGIVDPFDYLRPLFSIAQGGRGIVSFNGRVVYRPKKPS
jgi:hypothetical protein